MPKDIRIFTEDLKIAHAILHRDEVVTKRYLYHQCYPLFKRYFDGYYTDCENCIEFINEIYVLIMTPSRKTGRCRLMGYRGESTLTQWLKVVCKFYCYSRFEAKKRLPNFGEMGNGNEINSPGSDSFTPEEQSISFDFSSMNRHDIEVILGLMTNERYREIIRLRHVELLTDKETAETLGMTLSNFYNKHRLAKEMFVRILRKEECHA